MIIILIKWLLWHSGWKKQNRHYINVNAHTFCTYFLEHIIDADAYIYARTPWQGLNAGLFTLASYIYMSISFQGRFYCTNNKGLMVVETSEKEPPVLPPDVVHCAPGGQWRRADIGIPCHAATASHDKDNKNGKYFLKIERIRNSPSKRVMITYTHKQLSRPHAKKK